MATQTTEQTRPSTSRDKAVAQLTKSNGHPQPGAKKPSGQQRVIAEKNGKRHTIIEKPAKVVKADAMTGHRLSVHAAEATKSGVRIRLWMKGSKADPKKAEAHWLVILPNQSGAVRVITPDFDTEAAAKKAALAAGFKVVES